ncbi:hypothetical protein C0991_004310 [Blastosporella zonata]|nr:hypothetical protein C0991_004310 [Blastosporella zonata]
MAYYHYRDPLSGNNASDDWTRSPEGEQGPTFDSAHQPKDDWNPRIPEGEQGPTFDSWRPTRSYNETRKERTRYVYIPSTSPKHSPRQRTPIIPPLFSSAFGQYPIIPPPPDKLPYEYPPRPPFGPPPLQSYGYDDQVPTGWVPPVKYASVDPFRGKSKVPPSTLPVTDDDSKFSSDEGPDYVVYPYAHRHTVLLALLIDFLNFIFRFFFDSLPRQIYLLLLLYLPSFYFSRVARIFEEAEMTLPEIENMALQAGSIPVDQLQWSSPAGANLKATWEGFIDSLLREWKTLNIVSVLLLS